MSEITKEQLDKLTAMADRIVDCGCETGLFGFTYCPMHRQRRQALARADSACRSRY